MTTTTPNFAADMFRQFNENFNKAFQTGVKFHEDTFRTMNDTTIRTTDEFRNRVERFAEELTPVTKKNADRFTKMFDENMQRTNSFVRSAIEHNPFATPANSPTEMVDRTMNFWKSAFETTRESVEAFNKAGQDAWTNFTQCCKSCDVAGHTAVDAAAKKPAAK